MKKLSDNQISDLAYKWDSEIENVSAETVRANNLLIFWRRIFRWSQWLLLIPP